MDFGALPSVYWWIVGILILFGIARLITFLSKAASSKACLKCMKRIDKQASRCPHCGADVEAG